MAATYRSKVVRQVAAAVDDAVPSGAADGLGGSIFRHEARPKANPHDGGTPKVEVVTSNRLTT
jgi:hypothetical protein